MLERAARASVRVVPPTLMLLLGETAATAASNVARGALRITGVGDHGTRSPERVPVLVSPFAVDGGGPTDRLDTAPGETPEQLRLIVDTAHARSRTPTHE